jgi:phosphoesterase RecJ-like protein
MSISLTDGKRRAANELAEIFHAGQRVCLTTHVSPDGDGLGSEVGLLHLLMACGVDAVVANPTPTPPRLQFIFDGVPDADQTANAVKELKRADVIVVLDISDIGRLGALGPVVQERGIPVACIDHHVSEGALPDGPRYVDPTAAATGELIFEIAVACGWEVTQPIAQALYVAIMTDTGGFRFSNTHPRTLRIGADLLERGLHPDQIYSQVYASVPEGRPRLIGEALQTLVVEQDIGLAWITVPPGALKRHGLSPDDLDGVVEFPRSIEGISMALMFREISRGRVKVSLRSVGDVDVADFARAFGGGGHTKAAGLSVEGSLAAVQTQVLDAARSYLADGANGDGASTEPPS